MKTDKLNEIKKLRDAARSVAGFWDTWRSAYLSDSRCDKKAASFTSGDSRFAAFSFPLMFEASAGYYGNSSCSRILSLDNELAGKYFRRAIQDMAEPLFARAAELMFADADKLTAEAEAEIAALQRMLNEVRVAARDNGSDRNGEDPRSGAEGEASQSGAAEERQSPNLSSPAPPQGHPDK